MTEITVGIYRNYDYPDIKRQTPNQSGQWGNIRFLIDRLNEPCDILVVLNYVREDIEIECGEVWLLVQEPPVSAFPWIFEKHDQFDHIYSPYIPVKGNNNFIASHGALPWHVEKTYDQLKVLRPPQKQRSLSWITTNKSNFPGHKNRMKFLGHLKDSGLKFDLFGRGFNPVLDKYDVLGPYRYSLAIENFSGPNYWTEKVADCFLSWTMPLYYGCTNLADYFPEKSFIQIDINDPNVVKHIKEIINSDIYSRNIDAIAEARRRVLENFQLFPFIAGKLKKNRKTIRPQKFYPYRESLKSKIRRKLKRLLYAD